MDALFIIPTLVSSRVKDEMVPALSKLVERNIMVTNATTFKIAAIKRYTGLLKTVTSESTELYEAGKLSKEEREQFEHNKEIIAAQEAKEKVKNMGRPKTNKEKAAEYIKSGNTKGDIDVSKQVYDVITKPITGSKPTMKGGTKDETTPFTQAKDVVESPKGVSFFNMVSLEPTYLNIPISMRTALVNSTISDRMIQIGIKCVPYQLKDVSDILSLMKKSKSENIAMSYIHPIQDRILSKMKLSAKDMNSGEKGKTNKLIDFITFGPSLDTLTNPRKLSKLMSTKHSSMWSSLVILASQDIEGMDLDDLILNYRDMSQNGWGDMVIDDAQKGKTYFALRKMGAVQEIPHAYLKQILNLDNVIDFSDISRITRPFGRMVPFSHIVKENSIAIHEEEELTIKPSEALQRIKNIIDMEIK